MNEMFNELDAEVAADLASDPVYPWGEPDMRRWTVALRLSRERHGLADKPMTDEEVFGWFANVCCMGEAMANGCVVMNADGAQAIIDGEAVDPNKYFERWRSSFTQPRGVT